MTRQNLENLTSSHRWLIIVTIMMVAMLEVLDSTIVNVALPNMMPALSANQDQITWVLTSYVVASAIMIPLTGFLSHLLGEKKLLICNISGFMVSSFLCGLANSLSVMVVLRLFQGAFGAALIPISMSILRQTFPLDQQGKAMAIWGLGIMVAPVLGPTLGGYITQHADWRWVFYINMPICLLALALTFWVIPDSPKQKVKIDYGTLIMMVLGVGCLQLFLDQGNSNDWFDSQLIQFLLASSLIGIATFIYRSLTSKQPLVNLWIFKNRNFSLCTLSLTIYCGVLFGILTLLPIMLEELFGYTALQAGLILAPIGIFSALAMCIAAPLINRINVKFILIAGLMCSSCGCWILAHINIQTSRYYFLWFSSLTGFGNGLFMVPNSVYALATIEKKDMTEASGLYSYGRMLGVSIGISLLSTLVTRLSQINWHELGAHISRLSPTTRLWSQHFGTQNLQNTDILLQQTLSQQSHLLAFLDAYLTATYVFAIIIPFILLLKYVDMKKSSEAMH